MQTTNFSNAQETLKQTPKNGEFSRQIKGKKSAAGQQDASDVVNTDYTLQMNNETDVQHLVQDQSGRSVATMSSVQVEWLLLSYALDRLAVISYFVIFAILMAMYFWSLFLLYSLQDLAYLPLPPPPPPPPTTFFFFFFNFFYFLNFNFPF